MLLKNGKMQPGSKRKESRRGGQLNFLQQAISIKALISFEIRQLVEGW
jgi:hypothetical protein